MLESISNSKLFIQRFALVNLDYISTYTILYIGIQLFLPNRIFTEYDYKYATPARSYYLRTTSLFPIHVLHTSRA